MDCPLIACAGLGGWDGFFPFIGRSPLWTVREQFGSRRTIAVNAQSFLPAGENGDPFDVSQLRSPDDDRLPLIVDGIGHSDGADEMVAICNQLALINSSVHFRLMLFDPVRRNQSSGLGGLLEQMAQHDPIKLPANVISCVCFLRDSGGFPVHSPLLVQDTDHRNVTLPGTDHNTCCLQPKAIEVAAAQAADQDYLAMVSTNFGAFA